MCVCVHVCAGVCVRAHMCVFVCVCVRARVCTVIKAIHRIEATFNTTFRSLFYLSGVFLVFFTPS
jgi:hypothetical protein